MLIGNNIFVDWSWIGTQLDAADQSELFLMTLVYTMRSGGKEHHGLMEGM